MGETDNAENICEIYAKLNEAKKRTHRKSFNFSGKLDEERDERTEMEGKRSHPPPTVTNKKTKMKNIMNTIHT